MATPIKTFEQLVDEEMCVWQIVCQFDRIVFDTLAGDLAWLLCPLIYATEYIQKYQQKCPQTIATRNNIGDKIWDGAVEDMSKVLKIPVPWKKTEDSRARPDLEPHVLLDIMNLVSKSTKIYKLCCRGVSMQLYEQTQFPLVFRDFKGNTREMFMTPVVLDCDIDFDNHWSINLVGKETTIVFMCEFKDEPLMTPYVTGLAHLEEVASIYRAPLEKASAINLWSIPPFYAEIVDEKEAIGAEEIKLKGAILNTVFVKCYPSGRLSVPSINSSERMFVNHATCNAAYYEKTGIVISGACGYIDALSNLILYYETSVKILPCYLTQVKKIITNKPLLDTIFASMAAIHACSSGIATPASNAKLRDLQEKVRTQQITRTPQDEVLRLEKLSQKIDNPRSLSATSVLTEFSLPPSTTAPPPPAIVAGTPEKYIFHCTSFKRAIEIMNLGTINTPIERDTTSNIMPGVVYPGVYFSYGKTVPHAMTATVESSTSDSPFGSGSQVQFVMEYAVALMHDNFHMNRSCNYGHVTGGTLTSCDAKLRGHTLLQESEDGYPEIVFHDGVRMSTLSGIVVKDEHQRKTLSQTFPHLASLIVASVSDIKAPTSVTIDRRRPFLFEPMGVVDAVGDEIPNIATEYYVYKNESVATAGQGNNDEQTSYAFDRYNPIEFNALFLARFGKPYDPSKFYYENIS